MEIQNLGFTLRNGTSVARGALPLPTLVERPLTVPPTEACKIGCNCGRNPFNTYALPPALLLPAAVRPRPRAMGRTPT